METTNPRTMVNVKVNEGQNEVTIRHGKAPAPIVQEGVTINGDINAPRDYFIIRKDVIDTNKAVIELNHTTGVVKLTNDTTVPHKEIVIGSLKENPDWKNLCLNQQQHWDIKTLRNILKFKRHMFPDPEAHASIMQRLVKFNAKVEKEFAAENDGKGNSNNSVSVKTQIDQGLTEKFALVAPIFDGQPEKKIIVEICFDAEGGKLTCWMESVEFAEERRNEIKRIMNEQRANFASYVVVDQY